jgi:hypothetical protein
MPGRQREGLRSARLIMVLSSVSPLFVIWAVRGEKLVRNGYFVAACCTLVILPNLFLLVKFRAARAHNDRRQIVVGKAEDHRDHLLVYLFAMLLPFYTANLDSWREFAATIIAVCLIIFLFWNLNMHYMNVLFAIFGYRIFTVYPPEDGNPLSGRETIVLITRRVTLSPGLQLYPFRLSNSVLWESDQ